MPDAIDAPAPPDEPPGANSRHVRRWRLGSCAVAAVAQARRSALRQVVQTFFVGSTEQTVAALLDLSDSKLADAELDRLARLIDQARKEGR